MAAYPDECHSEAKMAAVDDSCNVLSKYVPYSAFPLLPAQEHFIFRLEVRFRR